MSRSQGLAIVLVLSTSPLVLAGGSFRRGDANSDGEVDISDPIRVLLVLYSGGVELTCSDAADANDDGAVDLSDVVFLLSFLFRGGPAPAEPFPACGPDPTDDILGCDAQAPCAGADPPKTIVRPEVVVLDPAATAISGAGEGTVTLSGSLGSLTAGSVLVSGEGMGLLRRVDSIEPSGAAFLLRTSPATLEDIFEEADIDYEGASDLGDVARSEPQVDGVEITPREAVGEGGGGAVSPSGGAELKITPVTIPLGPSSVLTVSTKVTVKMQTRFSVRIRKNALGVPTLQRFLFNPKLTVEGKVTTKLAGTFFDLTLYEKSLWKGYLTPITILVGGVPVVITPVIEAFVKVNAKGEVGIEIGPSFTLTAEGQVTFDTVAGWTFKKPIPQITFNSGRIPNVYGSLSAEVALAPRVSFLVYGFVGPYVELRSPFLKGEAKVQTAPPQGELSVDAGIRGLVGVQVAPLGQKLADYAVELAELSVNLYKKVYPLDPCAPDPENPNASRFQRGDVNNDGVIDLDDAIWLLNYLLLGGLPPLNCRGAVDLDAGDVNDNEHVTLADALQLMSFLFLAGPSPEEPFGAIGIDPDESARGFDREDPQYAVRAAATRVVDGRLILDLEILSPSSLNGFVIAMKTTPGIRPDGAITLDAGLQTMEEFGVEPVHIFGAQGDALNGVFSLQVFVLPTLLAGGTGGQFVPLCSVSFTVLDAAQPIGFAWLPDVVLNNVQWRAAVVGEDFSEHHPSLLLAPLVPGI